METNTGLLSLHDEVESPHPEGPLLPSTRKSQKSSLSAGDSEELSSSIVIVLVSKPLNNSLSLLEMPFSYPI